MSAYESFSSDESDGGALNEEDEDYEGVERGGRGDDDGVVSEDDALKMNEASFRHFASSR
ncbi:hypothetical protein PC116_g4912 [Phytophthora cactorum]|nr:hypothetical protein PC114_g2536 [Phytophthora cactorum]KAG3040143.1 hypothetical protein PC119_g1595 [Phytophthora cactorum]KAG4247357.1 hypothetical protein PC116_g4912 [Phytophthora cactorum]